MTERIYKEFNVHGARQLVESVTEAANTMYYVFTTKHTAYSEASTPTPNASIANSLFQTYDEMMFGKLVTPSDVAHSINNHTWANGTSYAMYDDTDALLLDRNYYVTTLEGSDYHVWKCIDNNSNSVSNSAPLYSDVSGSLNTLYIKSATDGYQWKFMYTIPAASYTKFTANNYIPVVTHANAVSNAINGAIDQFVVSNSGNNYNEWANGAVVTGTNTSLLNISSTAYTLSGNNDFYVNCSIYFTAGVANGEISKISDYTANATGKWITLETAVSGTPDSTTRYEISPTVTVVGDGSNCVARALINTSTNTISNVEILSRGSGYTYAGVTLEANNMAAANVAATRAVIGPFGGHGADPLSELNAKYVTIAASFGNNESTNIQTDNDFRTIGLLKNPLYANTKIVYDAPSANFQVGETALDTVTGASGIVIQANSTTVNLSNASGLFAATSNVTGQTTGASANIVSLLVNTNDAARANYHYFQQTHKFEHNLVSGSVFTEDERVSQATTGANGDVYASNSTYTTLTSVRGDFGIGNNYIVTGATSSQTARFKSQIPSDLVRGSGEVLFLKNIEAVSRSNTLTETVKLVLKF
jgi:hypothetical protein